MTIAQRMRAVRLCEQVRKDPETARKLGIRLKESMVNKSKEGEVEDMKTIYRTNRWKGYGKQNYYWNEYRLEGETVSKIRCHRQKFFDGKENEWEMDESLVESWEKTSSDLPEWLKEYL